jgi:hypothetical protein
MIKSILVKTITVSAFTLLITSCTHFIENPYANVPKNQLRMVSSPKLCAVISDDSYKVSQNVLNEVVARGYKDCGESEVYCRETLSLSPGTGSFANCRIARDQYNLNVQSQQLALALALQQIQVQSAALNRPQTINVYQSGYVNHYVY